MNLRGTLIILVCSLVGAILGAVIVILLMAAGVFDFLHKPMPTSAWGSFTGTPKVELLDDGRQLRLLEDFAYIDPRGKLWAAPKNSQVDGASIPQVFWSLTGGPLEGEFRNASIVHDVGCVRMSEPWEDVHFMFYEACRCGGLPENKAKIMYAAVYHFGPRWEVRALMEVSKVIDSQGQPVKKTIIVHQPKRTKSGEQPGADVREKLEKYVNEKNPSLNELKKLDPRSL